MNLLDYDITGFQISKEFECFCMVKVTQGEKKDPIESELLAIEKIKHLKELNEEFGITKSDRWYYYKKISIMEFMDMGLQTEDEHFFLNRSGKHIKTGIN